jgi:hypothetical protein
MLNEMIRLRFFTLGFLEKRANPNPIIIKDKGIRT